MSSAYHPESDGSTERVNRTVTQMIRQCVSADQRDWVLKLPAIEFAINLACSETTGYSPFFLNTGRQPRALIWNTPPTNEYPGVRAFAQQIKSAVMSAHDSIIAARVKGTRDANRRQRKAPFTEGDFVYLSTKNITLPIGLARKLVPKYIGPYKIGKDCGNESYQLDIPPRLRQRGLHDVFHASLLRIHVPNDDRLFPGRLETQVADFPDLENEWAVDKIITHVGQRKHSVFKVLWASGDTTWMTYQEIRDLEAFRSYLDTQGVREIKELKLGDGVPPQDTQLWAGAMAIITHCDKHKKSSQKNYKRARKIKPQTNNSHCTQTPNRHIHYPYSTMSDYSVENIQTLLGWNVCDLFKYALDAQMQHQKDQEEITTLRHIIEHGHAALVPYRPLGIPAPVIPPPAYDEGPAIAVNGNGPVMIHTILEEDEDEEMPELESDSGSDMDKDSSDKGSEEYGHPYQPVYYQTRFPIPVADTYRGNSAPPTIPCPQSSFSWAMHDVNRKLDCRNTANAMAAAAAAELDGEEVSDSEESHYSRKYHNA